MIPGSRAVPDPAPSAVPVCRRCGFEGKTKQPWSDGLCPSCIAEPPATGYLSYTRNDHRSLCRPWQGDFDADDNPVNPDGSLVLEGQRLCRHRDCVSTAHVARRAIREKIAA